MDFLWNIITIQVQTPPFIVKDFHHFNNILLSYSISISWPELSASAPHWEKREASPLSSLLSLAFCPANGNWDANWCPPGQWGTKPGELYWNSFLFTESQARTFFPLLFPLAKKQTNKIIIIIKGITSLPSHSDMLSAKTQIKSVRQGENAVKTGTLF